MKWHTKARNPYVWHRWFAWYPVRLTRLTGGGFYVSHWAWWEIVERQLVESVWGDIDWSYRELPR